MKLTKRGIIKNFLSIFLLISALGVSFLFTQPASAREASEWLNAVQDNGLGQVGNTDYNTNKPQDIRTIAANLTNVFLGLLGVIFILLMLAAGFIWMTAAGSAEKVSRAQKLMVAGAIGLLIIISAFAISLYVTSRTIYSVEQGIQPGGYDSIPSGDIKANDKYQKLF
jgi:NADH:ubiquinone oxidoreductase subunit 6 (subunit J)